MMSCLRERAEILEPSCFGHFEQVGDGLVLELGQVHRFPAGFELGRADDVEILAIHVIVGLATGRCSAAGRRDWIVGDATTTACGPALSWAA